MARKTIYMPLKWFEECIAAHNASLIEEQRRSARLYAATQLSRKQIAAYQAAIDKARAKGENEAPLPRD
jgi:hypothetical protein